MFTNGSRKTFALTSLADSDRPLFKVPRTVIDRGNYQLAFAICEAILLVSDDANEPVVERAVPLSSLATS